MSDAYERERQNTSRLDELSAKVSALRGVTVDIYDNAQAQGVIDNSNELFSTLGTTLRGSAGRLGRMAGQGSRVQVFKLAGILVVSVVVLWWLSGFFF